MIRELIANKNIRRSIGMFFLGAAIWYLWASLGVKLDAVAPLLSGEPRLWFAAGGLSFFYGATLFLLAFVWVWFLSYGQSVPPWRALFYIYTVTSIGKYLPGGVFHFGGRQALGARLGIKQTLLARASIEEAAVSVASALLIGGALYVLHGAGAVFLIVLMFAIAGLAVVNLLRFMLTPFLVAFLFMAAMALIAGATSEFLQIGESGYRIAGAYLIAWCIGFLIPGVSAGIGVREAALIFLLGGAEAATALGALAVIMRFITTVGDGAFFLSAIFFRSKETAALNKEQLTFPEQSGGLDLNR